VERKPSQEGKNSRAPKEAAAILRASDKGKRMRIWDGHTIISFLEAGRDAGWAIAMVVICITTFAVSSLFVKRQQ
jgi:hypothetical protein